MSKWVFAGLLLLITIKGQAQVVTTDPPLPIVTESVTLFFDASKGTGGLKNYSGDVYAHIGVITSSSTSSSDWKYVKSNWGQNTADTKMTRVSANLYSLTLGPSIRQYFGAPESEIIRQIAVVFRSGVKVGSNYLEGKDTGGKDIFVEVFEAGLNVSITSPGEKSIVNTDTNLDFTAVANRSASFSLYLNDDLVTSSTTDKLEYTFNFSLSGDNWIWVRAQSGDEAATDSIYLHVLGSQPEGSLDPDLTEGINYLSDTEATLVLYAPFKEHVFVIGEFNDWLPSDNYRMKKDGDHYFLALGGLTPKKEYAFQYLVDGELTLADPYTHKVLDPWNDKWIKEETYPDLKPYPEGKTEGIVSLLQTAQEEYSWKYDFEPHPAEDLVIYELLLRDFLEKHDWKTLTDTLNYFTELGVNAIELMPFNEFEGNESWGYNPSFYFAADKYYGPANDLKAFIDSCHNRGIAVIMDMVLNHSFGQSPFVRLYSNQYGHPTKQNPWYNADAVADPNNWYQAIHPYNVGFDFDHSSPQTQKLVDRINRFWLEEFRIDGYRFDLTKGITQKNTILSVDAEGNVIYDETEAAAYDPQRVGFLKRIADEIWKVNPDAYVILEHFTENSEEKELAEYGMMVWGNGNHTYAEASMGHLANSDFKWIAHTSRGWSVPHVVGYMESHDEERMMYRNLQFGNSSDNYSVRDLSTALFRAEMAAAFFFTIPGPKMIWQFGELGYDISINYNGRLGNKPRRWDYYHSRHRIFEIYSTLIHLKLNEPAFRSDDISLNLSGGIKKIALNHENMDVRIIGNFDVTSLSGSPDFSETGTWYDFFSGESLEVTDIGMTMELAPGEYRLYTNKALETPSLPTTTRNSNHQNIKIFPNPAVDYLVIEAGESPERIILRDLSGRIVEIEEPKAERTTLSVSNLPPGVYLLEVENDNNSYYHRFVKK